MVRGVGGRGRARAMLNGWVYMSAALMSNGLGTSLLFLMARQRLHGLPVRYCFEKGDAIGRES